MASEALLLAEQRLSLAEAKLGPEQRAMLLVWLTEGPPRVMAQRPQSVYLAQSNAKGSAIAAYVRADARMVPVLSNKSTVAGDVQTHDPAWKDGPVVQTTVDRLAIDYGSLPWSEESHPEKDPTDPLGVRVTSPMREAWAAAVALQDVLLEERHAKKWESRGGCRAGLMGDMRDLLRESKKELKLAVDALKLAQAKERAHVLADLTRQVEDMRRECDTLSMLIAREEHAHAAPYRAWLQRRFKAMRADARNGARWDIRAVLAELQRSSEIDNGCPECKGTCVQLPDWDAPRSIVGKWLDKVTSAETAREAWLVKAKRIELGHVGDSEWETHFRRLAKSGRGVPTLTVKINATQRMRNDAHGAGQTWMRRA